MLSVESKNVGAFQANRLFGSEVFCKFVLSNYHITNLLWKVEC